MARMVTQYLTDDLEAARDPGAEVIADRTIRFSVEGREYEIDLSAKNADGFTEAIRPYLDAGRCVRRQPAWRDKAVAPLGASGADRAAIRRWADGKGIALKGRGRIPAEVVARYEREASSAMS